MKKRTENKAPYDDERQKTGARICRWCGVELMGRRFSWCSEGCLSEYLIRADFQYACGCVLRRDEGICAYCGLDTLALKTDIKKFMKCRKYSYYRNVCDEHIRTWAVYNLELLRNEGFNADKLVGRRLWECDHIISVEDGGGGCGLEGLQTLCIPCHKRKTALENSRRARKKK